MSNKLEFSRENVKVLKRGYTEKIDDMQRKFDEKNTQLHEIGEQVVCVCVCFCLVCVHIFRFISFDMFVYAPIIFYTTTRKNTNPTPHTAKGQRHGDCRAQQYHRKVQVAKTPQ